MSQVEVSDPLGRTADNPHPSRPGARSLLPTSLIVRIRTGDLGSLPVIVGVVVIWGIFEGLNGVFLSSRNLVNLATDCAAIGVIGLGIVFALLLAQIDLSVGSMSGVASSILGVGLVQLGWPVWLAIVVALGLGACVGLIYGWIFIKFQVHTFVITLAGLLSLLGLQLRVLNTHGSINIPFSSWIVRFMQQMFVPAVASYVVAALVAAGYLASRMTRRRRRVTNDLPVTALTRDIVRAVVLLIVLEAGCWYLNLDRGVSAPFALFVVLVFIAHFALTRTGWGRDMFAVGGSVEAARRAGIKVKRVFVSALVLCSTLAALGGLLSAGRLAAATTSSGTADVNLDAIAAAVIGGTSLFGGRGSAYSALLGIVVIQSIANGLTLINISSDVRFMITGGVLMIAVIVDAVARKSRAAHGRA
jgi:ABC-type xylose transport system permease subunit